MSRRQRKDRAARRRVHAAVAGGGFAAVASLGTGAAQANTIAVTNLNDSGPGSFRQALRDATTTVSPGDSIVFASTLSGTINLATADDQYDWLYSKNSVQIVGPGAGKVTIHSPGVRRILEIHGNGTVSGLTFTGGNADLTGPFPNSYGGAIDARGTLKLDSVVLSGNTARYGGGAYAMFGITANNSVVSGNTAIWAGGLFSNLPITVTGSTISGNTARGFAQGAGVKGYGGGIGAVGGGTVTNSTITGNTAPSGAGIENFGAGMMLTLVGDTIAGNNVSAGGIGGQVAGADAISPVTLEDTIVAGPGNSPDVALPALDHGSASFSLIRNASATGGGSPITTDGTDKTGLDPKLGPLSMNGGPTPTMLPLPGSPVLDQGKSFGLTADQRGLSRPFALPITPVPAGGDRSDIGAVEDRDYAPALSKYVRAKLFGRQLRTGLSVACPAGGPSSAVSFKVNYGIHGFRLGKGSFVLASGGNKDLIIELSKRTLRRLKKHHKVSLTVTITSVDVTGAPLTIVRSIRLKP